MIAFGAAAATASATSIAACGGESKSNASDASQSDAAPSDAMQSHTDATSNQDVTSSPAYGAPSCPGPVNANDIIPWKPPTTAPGACTQMDVDAVKPLLASAATSFTDIYNALGNSCRQCMFSEMTSANWQPIVWSPDMAAGTAIVNYGACFAAASGGSAACGKATEDDQQCLDLACSAPGCNIAAPPDCTGTAQMGACLMYENTMTGACGANLMMLGAQCNTVLGMMNVLCGTSPDDGGSSDSGTD
jgi:hypothetical protein